MMLSTVVALFFLLIAVVITAVEPHLSARSARLTVPQRIISAHPTPRG
jgi:hypothetical protein